MEAPVIKKRRSIAFRLLILMTLLITVIFILIFFSFNFFVTNYIERETSNLINNAISAVNNSINGNSNTSGFGPYPHLESLYTSIIRQLQSLSYHDVESVIYTLDYTRIYPSSDETYVTGNTEEMDMLLEQLASSEEFLPGYVYRITINRNSYYFASINDTGKYIFEDCYILFFVNANKYSVLFKNIYAVLFYILIFATIFTLLFVSFITRSISKPLKKLCVFAGEIGKGNFNQCDYNFRDKEFARLNENMNETAYKLEVYDKDQKTFFQNVSHELRTPLMSVKGYAEGIKYRVFNAEEDKVKAAEIIISESDRLGSLVEDLLYISRIDVGHTDIKKIQTDITELIADCIDRLNGIVISNGKSVDYIRPEYPVYCYCGEGNMSRAIMNIIGNCIQYAKNLVTVSVNEYNGYLTITIKDDGDGISEDVMPYIFNRFYKGPKGKHGIGLSIAKSIIEQHGWEITARNHAGGGAEFIISARLEDV